MAYSSEKRKMRATTAVMNATPTLRAVVCSKSEFDTRHLSPSVVSWAERNKIVPFLADKIVQKPSRDEKLNEWAIVTKAHYASRSADFLKALASLFRRFDESNISDIVVVENFGTLVATESDLGLFGSGDVDLMACSDDKEKIFARFEQEGWRKTVRRGVTETIMTTFEKHLPHGLFFINLEWKFVSRRFFLREAQLSSRLKFWRENNFLRRKSGINVFRPDADFYMNCMHISIGHYYGASPGLRLYKDLEPYLSGCNDLDFDRIRAWSEEDQTLLRLETCLALYSSIYDRTFEIPFAISDAASKLALRVETVLDESEVIAVSTCEQIRLDQLSEQISLPQYLALRAAKSLVNSLGAGRAPH